MTVTLNANHTLTLPADAVAQAHLTQGMEFHVVVSPSGSIILRPARVRQHSLVEHLQGLEGLEVPRNAEPLSPPLAL